MNKFPFLFLVLISSYYQEANGKKIIEKPVNFIIIHVDDLGWTDLSSFGSEFYKTPSIDRLASEGMKFTQAYAAASICSPSRAAMMTGMYPARVGVTDWIRAKFQGGIIAVDGRNPEGFDQNEGKSLLTPQNYLYLDTEYKTVSEILKQEGYISCHIGKWHLGQQNHFPERRGFNFNIGGTDLGQPPSYFDPYQPPTQNEDYQIPNLTSRFPGEYLTDREGDEAVMFIRGHKDEKFVLHWAPYAVHTPLQGKEELVKKYTEIPKTNHTNPVYAAMIESLDENVGKILALLDELGLTENTVVIFTSDNGGLIGRENNRVTDNFPLRSGKGYPYEGGLRVPTIIRWPSVIKAGSVSEIQIISMDYLPTILDIIGLDNHNFKFDGISILEVLKSGSLINRDLFWHFPHYRENDVVPYSIVRSGSYKLIKYYDGQFSELYNLVDDVSESRNLFEIKPELVKELEKKINEWLLETHAKTPKIK